MTHPMLEIRTFVLFLRVKRNTLAQKTESHSNTAYTRSSAAATTTILNSLQSSHIIQTFQTKRELEFESVKTLH